MKICGSCLLNKQIYTKTNFLQQILIWNHDPDLEVGWIQTQMEMKTQTGLLRDIKEEACQEMCSLLGQW